MTKIKLTAAIEKVKANGEKAFVPYIMAGDGGLETLSTNILFLQEAGATAIEVGIPFSDPVADGPTIQLSGQRALAKGVNLRLIIKELETFHKEVHVPLVLMTYYNPLLSYGLEKFAEDCERIGISGLIVPDLPVEEMDDLQKALMQTDVAIVPLVSLTSPSERIAKIVSAGEGFIYAVTVNGTTGVRNGFNDQLEQHLAELKELSPLPVLAGFGISTPEQVKSIGALADGVIVGSAIVKAFNDQDLDKIRELIQASKNKVVN
ncbi:tryptophan synthase alpha chain [Psychrobacillus insolitus]|uniref:Tryptophan synthase alpha chain n=1 Tax=Psychrobacillus insolitus TaxID=1461 RepID=A0A2W7ML90_9BACI|nr:tryptophan synthase subunit alpha [Psychrobacillus insolitus]PZX07530.1 tryptophan synthase alpha chain [Psychrobacillus insolitus]